MKKKEVRSFQSEVKQLLNLMINSLYSNKEIFLRELISNSADAIDKLKFYALSNHDLYEGDQKFNIRIFVNKDKKKFFIRDNGIGMTRQEVIDNLGTIAKSGTKDFIKSMKDNKLNKNNFIGKFGVGFYSSFIVSDRVIVRTRYAGSKNGVYWESDGSGEYIVADIDKVQRGTEVILYLREDEEEFIDEYRIKNIISKYSDYVPIPIEMKVSVSKASTSKNNWEKINQSESLWTREKKYITDREYMEFYKYLFHDSRDPLVWIHNKVESDKQDYISLLYIPSQINMRIWNRDYKHGLKLYVQRVFVMDDVSNFLPNYLRFVKGLIDSNNLSLNVSREILQDVDTIGILKKSLTKRVLMMLENLSKSSIDKYQLFWNQFGMILKEGLGEDVVNKDILVKLLRFSSTYCNDSVQRISLEDYVSRMLKNQSKIYYLTSDSYHAAKNSPHLEFFTKQGVEVLLLFDRIDEWMMNYLINFDGKNFQLTSKSDLDNDNLIYNEVNKIYSQSKINNSKDEFLNFIKRVKKYLGDRVKEVKITNRLINTPVIVTTSSDTITTQMAKLFAAAGQKAPEVKYIFEININHLLIKYVVNLTDDIKFNAWIDFLLDQALLVEQGTLDDPNKFVRCINDILGHWVFTK